MRTCERKNSADTKVTEEGGGVGAPGTKGEIPLQTLVQTMVKQVVLLLQPMKVHSGADFHLQTREEPTTDQVDAPRGDCDPIGSPH